MDFHIEYKILYDNMTARNYKMIINNDIFIDDKLNNTHDDRKCLAILQRYCCKTFIPTREYYNLLYDIENIFKDQIVYYFDNLLPENGKFHHTLFQFVDFKNFNENVNTQLYYENFDYLTKLKYNIEYHGISFTKSGICLLGYPSIDLNIIRENIRQTAKQNDIKIYEPYYQNIVHSTMLRFSNKFELDIKNIDYLINKYNNTYLGEGIINNLQIEQATWKT